MAGSLTDAVGSAAESAAEGLAEVASEVVTEAGGGIICGIAKVVGGIVRAVLE